MSNRDGAETPGEPASDAEPSQASLPRVDKDAAIMTRSKVDFDLKDLVKKLSDLKLPKEENDARLLGMHEK